MSTRVEGVSGMHRAALILASLGGVGYCPIVPATAGSAVTAVLYLLIPGEPLVQFGVLAVVTVLGIWSAGIAAASSGRTDPSHVVIDEAAGMLIACFLLPKTPHLLLAAFLLFRVFDIGKWFPMKQLERLPGGWGIVADDLAAGLLARLCLLPWA